MKLSGLWMRTLRIAMGATMVFVSAACGNRDLESPVPVEVEVILTGQSMSTTSAQLVWVAPQGTDVRYGFRIYRDEVVIATLTSAQLGTGFTEQGLRPNTTYRYRIAVLRADGTESASSNSIFLTTWPASITIGISPASNSAVVGTPIQLVATVRDSASEAIQTGHTIAWSSSNGTVAEVSSTGVLTPHEPGLVSIAASTGGKSAQKVILVTAAEELSAASVTVSPAISTIEAGKTTQLSAIARDINGKTLTRTFTWSTSNAAIATVDQAGIVTTIATGIVTIRAKTGDAEGAAQITVTPSNTGSDVSSITVTPANNSLLVGGGVQLIATVRNAQGVVLVGRTITWTSETNGIATVTSNGLVSAKAAGTTVVVASTGGASGSAIVTVNNASAPAPEPVASITITPANATTSVGGAVQYSAVLRDASGTVLTGRTVVWTTSNATVALVGNDGRAIGVSVGVASITATSEGITATAGIAVVTNAPAPQPVSSLSLTPTSSTLAIGGAIQLIATAKDVSGNVLTGRVITWSSSDPSVASVSPTGFVTALTPGSVTITALSEGHSATAQVIVPSLPTPAAVNTITVSPSTITTAIGASTQFFAVLKDANGFVLLGRTVVWTSSDPTVATVNASGLATAIKAGTVTITATSEGKTGTATLTVNAVPVALVVVTPPVALLQTGDSITLTAITKNILGVVLLDRPLSWHSSDPSIATVSQTGVVKAVSQGAVIITATSEGIPGIAAITVGLKPVGTITVSPTTLSAVAGEVHTLTAVTRDVDGTVVTGRVVLWSTSNAAVAVVSQTGVVTAVSAGTATITAASEGKTATSVVTVTSLIKPVSTMVITPGTLSLSTLATGELTAVAKDENGVVLTGRVVVWTSSNPLVATVSQTGTVLALIPGTTTITATSEGKSATALVTVTLAAKPVQTITVSPSSLPLVAGSSAPLTATLRDNDGVILAGRVVTWTSSNNAIATVSALGNVTAVAAGTATITATSEGKSGTASVVVSALVMPVATVTLTPSPLSVQALKTAQLTATLKDMNGATLTGRSVVWTTSNPLIATVSQSGLVTGILAGTTTITATSEGISGSVTVTVTPAAAASVEISSTTGFCAGTSLQLLATVKDANGGILTGRAVVWTTSNAQIATVSNNGLLVGLTIGSVTVTATVDGVVSAQVTISLCAPVTATVQVTAPNNLLSLLGLPMQLVATPRDANGNVVPNRPVTWSVSPPLKALISLGGLVTPLLTGGITVTATIDGISASINLSIGN